MHNLHPLIFSTHLTSSSNYWFVLRNNCSTPNDNILVGAAVGFVTWGPPHFCNWVHLILAKSLIACNGLLIYSPIPVPTTGITLWDYQFGTLFNASKQAKFLQAGIHCRQGLLSSKPSGRRQEVRQPPGTVCLYAFSAAMGTHGYTGTRVHW